MFLRIYLFICTFDCAKVPKRTATFEAQGHDKERTRRNRAAKPFSLGQEFCYAKPLSAAAFFAVPKRKF